MSAVLGAPEQGFLWPLSDPRVYGTQRSKARLSQLTSRFIAESSEETFEPLSRCVHDAVLQGRAELIDHALTSARSVDEYRLLYGLAGEYASHAAPNDTLLSEATDVAAVFALPVVVSAQHVAGTQVLSPSAFDYPDIERILRGHGGGGDLTLFPMLTSLGELRRSNWASWQYFVQTFLKAGEPDDEFAPCLKDFTPFQPFTPQLRFLFGTVRGASRDALGLHPVDHPASQALGEELLPAMNEMLGRDGRWSVVSHVPLNVFTAMTDGSFLLNCGQLASLLDCADVLEGEPALDISVEWQGGHAARLRFHHDQAGYCDWQIEPSQTWEECALNTSLMLEEAGVQARFPH